MKNPKPRKSSNFIDSFDPTELFKNSFAVSIYNNKLQESVMRSIFSSTTLYSMTYNPSGFWSSSNRSDIPVVIDSGASRSITRKTSEFIGQITPKDEPIQGLSATTCLVLLLWIQQKNIRSSKPTRTSF